jgi:DNA helicase II / ATP-dependent DNA helicase PcrA
MIVATEALNDVQRDAVVHADGPVLIFAGAGSGKTRVLIHRIAHLIRERKVFPDRILAVTFTNRAASELRSRLEAMIGADARDIWAGTFHSVCVRILRRDGRKIGIAANFAIMDDADQRSIVREALHDLNYDERQISPNAALAEISKAKNALLTPDQYESSNTSFSGERFANVYREYDKRLRESNGLDFDDLIAQTIRLLDEDVEVRTRYQNKFQYILVDEYQDVNHAQYRLCAILAGEHKNITAVGDDDQSIYAWRGSDYKNILRFEQDFPGTRTFVLAENYRSTQAILNVASELIANNQTRKQKEIFTKRGEGDPVTAYKSDSERYEARYVVEKIKELIRENAAYRDFVVLYRTNAQSRVFEETMLSEGIPYRVVGGVGFYARTEIKDMIAYLRYIVNAADAVSFKRIVNVPRRSIGQQTIAGLVDAASAAGISVGQAIFDSELLKRVVPKKQKDLERFAELIENLRKRAESYSVSDLLVAVMEESGYIRELRTEDTPDAQARLENLQELITVAKEFETGENAGTLDDFLANVALVSDIDTLVVDDSFVTLMTLHASKGLEFPVVFLTGLEEGVFPHNRALSDVAEMEEERRLAYVGVTRAMDRLYLSYAERRTLFGNTFAHAKSRFLDEMPSVQAIGAPSSGTPKPAGGRWREVSIHETAGAGVNLGLSVGDRVRHPKWGEGIIAEAAGAGNDGLLTINFPNVGQKMVMLKYAPLEKVV